MFVSRGRTCFAMNSLCVFALFVFVLTSPLAFAASTNVMATRLDGTVVTGKLQSWDEQQVVLKTQTGEERLAADLLLALRWSASTAVQKPSGGVAGIVELSDGSLIPMSSLQVTGGKATIESRPVESRGKLENSVDVKTVAAVRFQNFDETLSKQWNEIRRLNLPNDLLVVLKHEGKSLDYIPGVLGEITDDTIEFKLDGEVKRIDRAKVAGLVYSRPGQNKPASPHFVLRGQFGLRASAASALLDDAFVRVTTASGASLRWPLDDLDFADFSSGKVMYLSDIDAATQIWTPLIGLPTGAKLAAEYGQPRRDHSAFGGPLTLFIKDQNDVSSRQSVPRSFAKGLALRSRTELVYRIPDGFNRFAALAGIDPATTTTGNVHLAILADDHPLLEAEIAGDQPPQPIDVQITGAKRLKIIVDFGQNLDTGDWLNLCDAKITK